MFFSKVFTVHYIHATSRYLVCPLRVVPCLQGRMPHVVERDPTIAMHQVQTNKLVIAYCIYYHVIRITKDLVDKVGRLGAPHYVKIINCVSYLASTCGRDIIL